MANPVVTFEMENGDIMKAELYPEIAPNTVKNFVSLDTRSRVCLLVIKGSMTD